MRNLLEPCEIVKYEAETLSWDKYSTLSVVPENLSANASKFRNGHQEDDNDKYDNNKYIYFYYATTEVNVLTEEFILDFPNFVSAIGGNLGMFIGFSFLGFFNLKSLQISILYKNVYKFLLNFRQRLN